MHTKHLYPLLRTEGITFGPVMILPDVLEVYDFTAGYDPSRMREGEYGVGRYDEHRPGMYLGEQFLEGKRELHVGIDLAAPPGQEVLAFYDGSIHCVRDNALPYDYGPTIITKHAWLGQTVYALYGHLSRESLAQWRPGDAFCQGAVLASVGRREVNGGWNPHLHFQLSLVEPTMCDLPGAVSLADRDWALRAFPDPQKVLGSLY